MVAPKPSPPVAVHMRRQVGVDVDQGLLEVLPVALDRQRGARVCIPFGEQPGQLLLVPREEEVGQLVIVDRVGVGRVGDPVVGGPSDVAGVSDMGIRTEINNSAESIKHLCLNQKKSV